MHMNVTDQDLNHELVKIKKGVRESRYICVNLSLKILFIKIRSIFIRYLQIYVSNFSLLFLRLEHLPEWKGKNKVVRRESLSRQQEASSASPAQKAAAQRVAVLFQQQSLSLAKVQTIKFSLKINHG